MSVKLDENVIIGNVLIISKNEFDVFSCDVFSFELLIIRALSLIHADRTIHENRRHRGRTILINGRSRFEQDKTLPLADSPYESQSYRSNARGCARWRVKLFLFSLVFRVQMEAADCPEYSVWISCRSHHVDFRNSSSRMKVTNLS